MISAAVEPSPRATAASPIPAPRVTSPTDADWAVAVDGFSDANFYQTAAYADVSWGIDQSVRRILEQDQRTVAGAQLRIVRIPGLRAGVAYLRWGPFCTPRNTTWSPELYRASINALTEEFSRKQGLLLRILPNVFVQDPHAEEVLRILHESGFRRESDIPAYRTFRVDLRPDPANIRKRLDQKWRNQLNGAERNGLQVELGTDDSLYQKFLALYHEMMDRKQFETTVDPLVFQKLQAQLPIHQKMWIAISSKDGQPLTGLVTTSVGDTGIYLLGATSNAGMKSKGSYLLQWLMMNRLRESGCSWYDLGGINPQTNPGVYHFKEGMGGEDCQQLGRFVHSGNLLSNTTVAIAERLQKGIAALKARLRRPQGPPTPKPPPPPADSPSAPQTTGANPV